MRTVEPSVTVIAYTKFEAPDDVPWKPDIDGDPQSLIEFAGRNCYGSWDRPNPKTATNADYISHIISIGHRSVVEHSTASFYITGISRSLTHELVRHRVGWSYSQRSQRYVDESAAAIVEPDVISAHPHLHAALERAVNVAQDAYSELVAGLEEVFADEPNRTLRRKQARQAARAVLPNATETHIVATATFTAWRHFVAMRATEFADVEIRRVAIMCLRELQRIAPNVFGDFTITALADGTEIAASNMEPQP
jgi:thymidylate synthase (FAD)